MKPNEFQKSDTNKDKFVNKFLIEKKNLSFCVNENYKTP